VTVSWTAVTDPDSAAVGSWRVRWRTAATSSPPAAAGPWQGAGGANDLGVTVAGASTRSHAITGLDNGTAYEVQVAATNRIGNGPWSPSSDSVTPDAPPNKVAGVSAAAGATSVTVSWTAATVPTGASAVSGYTVQYVTAPENGDPDWSSPGSATATPPATSVTVESLVAGTGYVFRVRAANAAGDGAWSDTASVRCRSRRPTGSATARGRRRATR